MLDINTPKKRENIIVMSINEEYIKFHSPSYEYENDSLNTYFSYENHYPFIYGCPYIYVSENDEYSFFNPNNPNSNMTGDIEDFKNGENPILLIEKISPKFSVSLKQGRGPKPKDGCLVKRHRHLNTNFDNLQVKIQVNYINFIKNLSNDVFQFLKIIKNII